jgi:hypothetical protein
VLVLGLHRRQLELGEPLADRQLHAGRRQVAAARVGHEHAAHGAVADDDAARVELDLDAVGGAAEQEERAQHDRREQHRAEVGELLPPEHEAQGEREQANAHDEPARGRHDPHHGREHPPDRAHHGTDDRPHHARDAHDPLTRTGERRARRGDGGRHGRAQAAR